MKCPRCAADLPDRARFCPACGAAQQLVCTACGEPASPAARFCGACGVALTAPAPPAVAPPATPAERRQLSVMFCDLVGSTPLTSRLDPEDMRALLSRYQRAVAETVQHHGGFVARYMGDGLLVYFGWPRADEANPERAVRAGLAAIEAVRRLPTPTAGVSARVGIATGLAVVGDLIGEGAAREQAIIGEAPNLAARLQSAAEPGTVVIDAATRALIGGMFECRALAPLHLKGWSEPVPAWIVDAPAALQSRSEALYGGALSPLIGREEELELLLRRWRAAVAGEGHVVLISGEPGIGKSRLMAELERRLAPETHETRRYFCSPYQQDTPLFPVTARWEREAGFARGDAPEDRLRKLRAVMDPSASPEDVSLFADVLNLPAEGRLRLDFSPRKQRELTLALFLRLLAALAARRPVLMLMEDAHWADASTIELFDHLIRELSNLRVLLVMSFRSEYRAPWIGQAGVTLVTLSRLTRRQSAALATQVVLDLALPPPLLERVVAQTDGVPLFIEELTRTLLDRADAMDIALTVPTTLQASLLARLDRIPAAKQVAQIAAVIGRAVPHALLAEVAGLPDPILAEGLETLVASGLAYQRGLPPEATYVFKHALVQEAAYESLLRSRRAEIHGAVAAALARNPEPSADAAATIGRHFAQSGQIEQAISWYRRAGERSAERSAIAETKAQLQRGLQLAATLPDSPARQRMEAVLQLTLGRMLLATGGNADLEAGEAFERAGALCRSLKEPEMLAQALGGKFLVIVQRGDLEASRRIGEELLALADADRRIEVAARLVFGGVALWSGRFTESCNHLQLVLENSDRAQEAQLDLASAASPDGLAAAWVAGALAIRGHAREAAAVALDAMRRVAATAHVSYSAVAAMTCRAILWLEDYQLLAKRAQEVFDLSGRMGFPHWEAHAGIYLGWLAAHAGDIVRGLARIDHALADMDQRGMVLSRTPFLNLRAECLVLAKRYQEALATLNEALEISASSEIEWVLAEIHRLKGEALLPSDPTTGEDQLRTALSVARRQEARLWELRAALSLARHLIATGRGAEARDLLAPICNWFDPATTIPTLADARALLAQAA